LTGFYGAAAGGPWLLWSAWPTPGLSAWGFQLVGHPPLMVRLPGSAPPPLPPELRIVEVHDAASLADAEQTLIEGYPAPELQPFRPGALWDTRILGGPLHIWVGYAGERPVTTGMAYVDERVTGVYVIATLVVYHGAVNEESDGPVEVCVPVSRTQEAATDRALRREPAHREAYVRLTKAQVAYPQILSAYDAVAQWIGAHGRSGTGSPREVYFTDWGAAGPTDEVCDVAFPIK
jgi:hypothetical protein